MSKTIEGRPDDLEAVRIIAEELKPFNKEEQERILRWAQEKIGLSSYSQGVAKEPKQKLEEPGLIPHAALAHKTSTDIKTFVTAKNPKSDTHFAATVAYFYKFEAPQSEHKDYIKSEDLQEACRKVNRDRLTNPLGTLNNAHRDGYLDRASEKGSFSINTVGENLVAMTLPSETASKAVKRKKSFVSKKTSPKRKVSKRT